MKHRFQGGRTALAAAALLAAILAATGLTAAAAATGQNAFVVHNLVSDVPGLADHTDPDLVNAWGLTSSPTSPWWVADNETNVSTLYRADGSKVSLVVKVPNAPTGAVSNSSGNFVVTNGTSSGAARFLFDTEEGKILGWNPAVAPTDAVVAVDRSNVGAIYKGLAISSTENTLYAADFHNSRVDAFDQSGTFLGRVVNRGQLNAPWGLARAPASFGPFGGDLLVGNFGNGRINAYEPQADGSYERVDAVQGDDHMPIEIDGLWAIAFGKGAIANNGPTDTLFFTAGPDDESHGLFGTIRAN